MVRVRVVVEMGAPDESAVSLEEWGEVARAAVLSAGATSASVKVAPLQRPRVGGRTHGVRSTYSAGCRCEECRAAEREHTRRRRARLGPPAPRVPKTHCVHGHEFTAENTALVRGVRVCKECRRRSRREALQRRRSGLLPG